MLRGKYQPPGGTGSWETYGNYILEAVNPTAGIYGLVLQLAASGYISSEPFLLPMIDDPSSSFGAIQVAEGISALQQAVLPLPAADFDRDTKVDAADLAIWSTGYGTQAFANQLEGDATGDGAIAGDDFLAWQRQLSNEAPPATVLSSTVVPEPATLFLVFDGKLALMVHTNLVGSGEIGGFLTQVPEPGTISLVLAAIGMMATQRRQ